MTEFCEIPLEEQHVLHKKPTGNVVYRNSSYKCSNDIKITNLRKFRLAPAWKYFAVRNKLANGYIHVGSSEYLDAIVAFVSD